MPDALSRDWHLNDTFLDHLLFFFFPKKLPASFQIFPLPDKIASFIIGILEAFPMKDLAKKLPSRSTIRAGLDRATFPNLSTSADTCSWIECNLNSELLSSACSQVLSEKLSTAGHMSSTWHKVQSNRTSTKWARPSNQTFGSILPGVQTINSDQC